MISQKQLKEILHYNPIEGSFVWRKSIGSAKAGNKAGYIHHMGYHYIGIKGEAHSLHRLAWIYSNGSIPEGKEIDHLNGNKSDNRLANLRTASRSMNCKNSRMYKSNASGLTGVALADGAYTARIQTNGKAIHLGRYDNIFDAACARRSAELRYNFSGRHGR